MMRYSIEPKDRIFAKGNNMGKNLGKNISKNLNGKHSHDLLDHAKKICSRCA